MAGSTHQGKRPLFFLLMGFMGFIGLSVTSALGQDTVYIGGTGGSVEINLDVLDQLGASQTVPQMLQTDIRRSQRAAGIPLPLTGETPAAVTLGLPLPPPSRPVNTQSRRSVAARPTALPLARVQQQPTVPIVAPPATVAITAPKPKSVHAAPKASADATRKAITKIPDIVIPAAPKTAARTATIVPPPPPAITPPAITPPAVNVTTPPAQAPEQAEQVASAPSAPKVFQSPPKSSTAGAAISIAFETDTKSLPADADGTLDEVVEKMNASKSERVQLIAFASAEERSEAKARRLSLSRALEVRSYLIRKGIASTRIDVRALGNQASSGSPDRVDLAIVSR
jgi:outer membrane protein OmpA-like peptidoglycan-associated protein